MQSCHRPQKEGLANSRGLAPQGYGQGNGQCCSGPSNRRYPALVNSGRVVKAKTAYLSNPIYSNRGTSLGQFVIC